ncbi:type VI secretion system-associated protein TagF [Rhodopila sp.]|jgi:type VI secretion system protein ImpM|uniref:type VI secretion system-associated protein TagF n=1 Tax=Rhodopila sp. TaxID=2480087 RepID=UPI002C239840|nr:type VI secretion system-associated protein TagF [Rhodopila sp.]HVZ09625.1 type VI secretion system-associated protein TagF [Rhodopila sp.]
MSDPCRGSAGFFGKLPSRGDFVSNGLATMAVGVWDRAVASVLTAARVRLAERFASVWLVAPVWRFALPAGMCGPEPLLGLWMPSVDKVGRYFPLMIAGTCPGAAPACMARCGGAWLDAAEMAGRSALADDLAPDRLAALIPACPDLAAGPATGLPYGLVPRPGAALWWTEGSPLVPAQGLVLDGMPEPDRFLCMLDASLCPGMADPAP